MSGSKTRFDDDGELDQLADDFDLDMDAPIGATFAAALRDRPEAEGERKFSFDEDELGGGDFDLSPTSRIADTGLSGHLLPDDPFIDEADALHVPDASTAADDSLAADAFAIHQDTAPVEDAPFEHDSLNQDLPQDEAPLHGPLHDALAEDEGGMEEDAPSFDAAPAPSAEEPAFAHEQDAPPPYLAEDDVASAEADSAGNGLGYDYAFSSGPSANGDRMIPRISIHAFCTQPGLLALMHTIGKDRRMRNVAMDVLEGGVPAAIKYYVNEPTPNLLLIEGAGDPRQLLADLDALAQHCDETIRVVVIGHTNDIRLYRELMRRGVSEYLVAPVDPVQLIRSIAGLFADPEAPFIGKTLAVTGVKGGVGASSVAHNLAWALSERLKINATLVDLDLNFGTTGLDFNEEAAATIADALMSPDRFDDAVMGRLITKATDRLSLFTAPATLDRTYNLEPETYSRVLEQVRGSVPFVVLDLPHIWSDWFKSTIIGADEICVVAGPDLASLRNGKNLIDFLKAARPNDQPPKLILNMVGVPKRPEIPAKDFGQAIGLEPTLILPFEPHIFGTAANNGQMIFDVGPDSKCAAGIDQLATLLTGREVQTSKPSLMKKLLGR